VRTEAPPLLPLFRSEGQGRLLARVYLAPDRPAPIAEIARELNLDAGGLTREADRLERAGLVRSQRIGRQRLLQPNKESLYYPELHGLLLKAFGPAALVGPALAEVPGVEQAFLFGSWAARYLGEAGPEPADLDVMVVGRPSRGAVSRVARALTERLGREVNATIVPVERWRDAADGFVRQVQRGPLVEVDLAHAGDDAR
jgi:predicted nucleotidyltransferase